MKIGEAFSYKIDDRIQLIRKEKSFYLTFTPKDMSFYQLDEFPVLVIKHSLNNTLPTLAKKTAKEYKIPLSEVKETIKSIQNNLSEINLLKLA